VTLFPELVPYLRQVWEQAEPGTEFLITRYRQSNANLRTQFGRIIRKARLEPWPKLFQNLRATRTTELVEEYPEHKENAWMGHSAMVSRKHYQQMRDEDFDEAARGGANLAASVVQKEVQHVPAASCTVPQRSEGSSDITRKTSGKSDMTHVSVALCETLQEADNGRYRTRTCDLTGVICPMAHARKLSKCLNFYAFYPAGAHSQGFAPFRVSSHGIAELQVQKRKSSELIQAAPGRRVNGSFVVARSLAHSFPVISTLSPTRTYLNRSITSRLERRMHPCEANRPS
jgi:hypothetical protein